MFDSSKRRVTPQEVEDVMKDEVIVVRGKRRKDRDSNGRSENGSEAKHKKRGRKTHRNNKRDEGKFTTKDSDEESVASSTDSESTKSSRSATSSHKGKRHHMIGMGKHKPYGNVSSSDSLYGNANKSKAPSTMSSAMSTASSSGNSKAVLYNDSSIPSVASARWNFSGDDTDASKSNLAVSGSRNLRYLTEDSSYDTISSKPSMNLNSQSATPAQSDTSTSRSNVAVRGSKTLRFFTSSSSFQTVPSTGKGLSSKNAKGDSKKVKVKRRKLAKEAGKKYLRDLQEKDGDRGSWTTINRRPSVASGVNGVVRSRRKRKSRRMKKAKVGGRDSDECFEDKEVLSDEDGDVSVDTPSADSERDTQWLLDDSSEEDEEGSGGRGKEEPAIITGVPAEEASDRFINCVNPLFFMMKITGRMPFTLVKHSKTGVIFEFNRRSKKFAVFCVTTAILILFCLAMILHLVMIIRMRKTPKSFYEDVLTIEFDKFWMESFLTIISLYFVCVCSLALIFDDGIYLSEYLTRWNLSIGVLKYDVGYRLKCFIWSCFILYVLYACGVIALFVLGGERIPTVRGASGFLGLMIFDDFVYELRVHWMYPFMEYVGLLVHLYVTWCSGVILMLILVYCISLRNAAQRFNLRVGLALSQIAYPDGGKMLTISSRMIPFKKLWGEHTVVTCFSRHTGTVFSVPLHAFYMTKMLSMILSLYGTAEVLLSGFPNFTETYFNLSSDKLAKYNDSVPIRYAEPDAVWVGKSLYYSAECWFGCLIFSEIVYATGESIMSAYGYVRKHGYPLCRSSTERRFITSMQNSYAPNNSYYINPGFQIDRDFILGFIAFVFVWYVTLMAFHPSRLATHSISVCDETGLCRTVVYRKAGWSLEVDKLVKGIKTEEMGTSTTPTRRTTTGPKPTGTGSPKPGTTTYPPCMPYEGNAPVQLAAFTQPCFNFGTKKTVYLPTVFTKTGRYYEKVRPNCKDNTRPEVSPVFDCFGEEVTPMVEDECKMLQIPTPDEKGKSKQSTVEISVFSDLEPQRMFCCFKYAHEQLVEQVDTCNLWNPSDASAICSRTIGGARDLYEELLWREIKAWEIVQNPRESSKLDWDLWTKCICQDLIGGAKTDSECAGLLGDYSPCSTPFLKITHTNEQFELGKCAWADFSRFDEGLKMQILYKQDKYLRYYPINVDNAKCGFHQYPEDMNLDQVRNGAEFKLKDCFGNEITDSVTSLAAIPMDECLNLKLAGTPLPGTVDLHLVPAAVGIDLPGIKEDSVFCCFLWNGKDKVGRVCNLKPTMVQHRCKRKVEGDTRKVWEKRFIENQKVIEETGDEERWKKCICQGVLQDIPVDDTVCNQIKPPGPLFPLDISQEDYFDKITFNCPGANPLNPDERVIGYTDFSGKNIYYFQSCDPSELTVNPFVHLETGESVWDGYGNEFKREELRDDCGNFPLRTPSKVSPYSPVVPGLVPVHTDATRSHFRCCWEYSGLEADEGAKSCSILYKNLPHVAKTCVSRLVPPIPTPPSCRAVFASGNMINLLYNGKCLDSKKVDVNGRVVCDNS